jgi:O-antigen ligase
MSTDFRQIMAAFSDQAIILLPFAVILGVAAIAAIYRRPAIGAFLILFSAPLEGFLMVGGNSFVKLATVLCVGVFLARVLLITRGFKVDSVALFSLAFVAWAYASIVWTPEKGSSLSSWTSFALSTALYLVLINFVASKDDLKLVVWGHVLGGTILAVVLINVEVATAFQRKDEVAGLGLNLAARLTALNAVLSLFLLQVETATVKRSFLLVALVLSVLGAVVSLSRGAWAAIALSLVALFAVNLLNRRITLKPSHLIVSLAVVAATLSILSGSVLNEHGAEKLAARFQSGINLSDDAGGRLDIWQVGWTMFSDAPLQGHGYGSFGYYYHFYSEGGSLGTPTAEESKAPHNTFVGILVQFGVVGLVLFLGIVLSTFRKTWALWNAGPRNSGALAWASALGVFLVAANFVDYAVDRKYLLYALGLVVLIAKYISEKELAKAPEVVRRPVLQTTRLTVQNLHSNR